MDNQKTNVQNAVSALRELASLETQTFAAELNVFGLLRDRISPAARYGEKIIVKYRRLNYKTDREIEDAGYLPEGFPTSDTGKPITSLLIIDNYSTQEIESGSSDSQLLAGHYVGDRLFLTRDRKWILAERVGAFSEAAGSTSEWEAHCRALSDRALLERHPLETITEGLFAATNRLWENLSPRMDAMKKRHEKVNEISTVLSRLGGGLAAEGRSSTPAPRPEENRAPKVTRR